MPVKFEMIGVNHINLLLLINRIKHLQTISDYQLIITIHQGDDILLVTVFLDCLIYACHSCHLKFIPENGDGDIGFETGDQIENEFVCIIS
jgi:hypothetical protein